MIRLTQTAGSVRNPIYINPEKIISIELYEDETCTRLYMVDDNYYFIIESPEEVSRKVLEWKYIMQKGAYTNTQEMARLRELAGLEDTNHDA